MRCGIHTALLRDHPMLHAVVEFGAAVYGKARSAGGLDSGNQFHSVLLHSLDSNKAMFAPDECTALAWRLPSPMTLVSTLDSLSAILPQSSIANL